MKTVFVGLEGMLNRLGLMAIDVGTVAEKVIQDMAVRAVDRMQAEVPVRTGALRSSITATPQEGGVLISAGSKYAWFIEYGTLKSPAQPFFMHNIDSMVVEVKVAVVAELERRFGK